MSKPKRFLTYKEVMKKFKKRKRPKTAEQRWYLNSLKMADGERMEDSLYYTSHMGI